MPLKAPPQEVGTLYGYQLLVQPSEYDNPYAVHKWAVPRGTLKTDDPTKVFGERTAFSLDSIVSLVAFLTGLRLRDRKAFDDIIVKEGFDPRTTFTPHLMRRLVTLAVAGRDLPDQCAEAITPEWLLRAEQVLMDMAAIKDREARRRGSVSSLAMRVLQDQFHDQLDFSHYKRELWLNRSTVAEAQSAGLDLEKAYEEAYGFTYSELAFLSFAAYSTLAAKDGVTIEPSNWNRNNVTKISRERLDSFFKACSADYLAFKSYAADENVVPTGLEIYALSPLIRWPLIKRTDGHLVAPIIADLLERPTRGFPIDALRALSRKRSAAIGTFTSAVGTVYEQYVRESLERVPGSGDVKRAQDLLPPGSKNCDFICLEPGAATLVEAKAVRLRLMADITKDRAALRAEFGRENGIADGLIQLNETARAIRQDRAQVPKRAALIGLLVVRGEQVLMNSPFVRQILEELVRERSESEMIVSYQIANDVEFDALIRKLRGQASLNRFLYRKRKDKVADTEDIYHTVWRKTNALPDHPLKETMENQLDDLLTVGLSDRSCG